MLEYKDNRVKTGIFSIRALKLPILPLVFCSLVTFTACAGGFSGADGSGSGQNGSVTDGDKNYREGEVLVGLHRERTRKDVEHVAGLLGAVIIERVAHFNRPVYLLRLPPDLGVEDAVNKLKGFEEVEFAEPNYIFKIMEK